MRCAEKRLNTNFVKPVFPKDGHILRRNKDIHGIMVGNEDIKLEIFADDKTAFLRDHASLDTLLNMVDSFSLHSRLKINFKKTEVLFLGNDQESTMGTVISSYK